MLLNRQLPNVGFNSSVIILNVVVLPAPLIPSRPKQCPHGIEKQTLLTAQTRLPVAFLLKIDIKIFYNLINGQMNLTLTS